MQKSNRIRQIIEKQYVAILLVLIMIATFLLYFPVMDYGFTTWDDGLNVAENPYIKVLNMKAIWFHLTDYKQLAIYHPLTSISHCIEFQVFGLDPGGFHSTNLIIHLLNIPLVFVFVSWLLGNKQGALIATALFALHPLNTEPIAWISSRKDLLYTFFFLLAILAYIRYIDRKRILMYWLSIPLLLFSLMSKGTAVTFPAVVLLIDYLRGRDFKSFRLWIEKVPYFVLSILFGIIALLASPANQDSGQFPGLFPDRFLAASHSLVQYIIKTIVPNNQMALYPYLPASEIWFYPIVILAIIVVTVLLFRHFKLSINSAFNKTALFGFMFFFINIILLLQIIPNSFFPMADRYMYLAGIGLFLIPAIAYTYIGRRKLKIAFLLIFVVYLAGLSYVAKSRLTLWGDDEQLWSDVLEKDPDSFIALNKRGNIYSDAGKVRLAITDYSRAARLYPDRAETFVSRAYLYIQLEEFQKAIKDLDQAIKLNPESKRAYLNRGYIRIVLNQLPQAIADLSRAIEIDKNYAQAYLNRGIAYDMAGQQDKAIYNLFTATQIDPNLGQAWHQMGMVQIRMNETSKACLAFQNAAKSGYEPAHEMLMRYCK